MYSKCFTIIPANQPPAGLNPWCGLHCYSIVCSCTISRHLARHKWKAFTRMGSGRLKKKEGFFMHLRVLCRVRVQSAYGSQSLIVSLVLACSMNFFDVTISRYITSTVQPLSVVGSCLCARLSAKYSCFSAHTVYLKWYFGQVGIELYALCWRRRTFMFCLFIRSFLSSLCRSNFFSFTL